MSGLPIDINTSAASTDHGGTRANRPRRDGDLRAPQFEQLLLALTAAKPLPCGTNELSTPPARKTLPEGLGSNSTRYAARNEAPSTTVVEHDTNESEAADSDVEVEATSDTERETSEEPQAGGDSSPQLVACTFDNHKVPVKPDAPAEEPAGDVPVVEVAAGERKRGVAKLLAVDTPSAEPAGELPATPVIKSSVETAVPADYVEEVKETPADLTVVAAERVRRGVRGRPGKEETDKQAVVAESPAQQVQDAAAVSSDAVRKTASRGSEHPAPLANEAQSETQAEPKLASISSTHVAHPVTEEAAPTQSSQDPATKDGLKESRLASADEAPKSSVQANAPVAAPPAAPAPTNVVPPVVAPAAQLQATQATNSSAAASSKTDATGAVTTTPTNRLPHKAIAAARSNGPAGSSQIDTVKFIQRIARAMQSAREAGGEIRLRLSPPELGSMKMEVKVQDGTLVAKVETETAQAQSTLVDNLPALKERLAEQGVRIERFDVDVSRDDRGQSGFADRQGSSDRGSQPRSERRDAFHRQVGDPVEAGSVSNPITTPQSINVVA